MTETQINNYIDKIHFRTFNHLQEKVKAKFPKVNDELLKKIIKKRLKDKFVKVKKIKPYFIKIFSTQPNCWFHDLLDNGKDQDPRYWHIFIGTNNHFAVALPLKNKSAISIRKTLTDFIQKFHPRKLTSDEESGFIEKNNVKLLSDNNVKMQIITEKNHSALGIIDRFIRTLRDMNIPTQKGSKQSHYEKYQTFSEKRMNKLIEIYNTTFHSRIKCSPKEMFENPDLEKEYIFKQLYKREKQEKNIKNLHLKVGMFVRYILPKANGKRKRFQISRECYKIESVKGNIYTLIAKDGTVSNFPRFKLMLCKKDGSKPDNIKFAETFPNKWNGVISKILSYNPDTQKYRVTFKVPDSEDYIDEIPASYLRGNFPQELSKMELDFIKKKNKELEKI